MKILLLGCDGQLGWALQRSLAPLGEVLAIERSGAHGDCGDLERPDDLRSTIRAIAPAILVNAAAYTNVDGAEQEAERAERVNAVGPAVLAAEAARLRAWLVHFSTDYVFDGGGTRAWRDDDVPAPLNVYGATKRRGEQAIYDSGCRHLILRTQWIHGPRHGNFVRSVLRAAAGTRQLCVVDDQVGAPTSADLVADVTAHAIRAVSTRPELGGTYHVAARGSASRLECARFVVNEARRAGASLRVAAEDIVPSKTSTVAGNARRPLNCQLDCALLESTFGLRMPDWREGVARTVAAYLRDNRSA
jgi:dTDP-4-dehydrorhamnose reductase